MDTNIEKSYPELRNVNPYDKHDQQPDEIKSWEEFDRALATLIKNNEDHGSN